MAQTAQQSEFDALGRELNNIMNKTTFGGAKLLKGGKIAAAMTFQIGSTSSETMSVDPSTQMATLDSVGAVRASLSANSNRLDQVFNNLSNISNNTSQAKGRIMDVDYASETANMTTKQMLMQAGNSMLKQSNSMSQLVMSLMQ